MESAAAAETATVIHRALLALLLIAGAGCGRPSADVLFRRAEQYKQQENFRSALESAEEGFRREPSWRFRLLKADILLASRKAREALEALRAPEDSLTPEQRAQLAMYRGTAAYLLSDYPAAEADLVRARLLAKRLALAGLDGEIELRLSTVQVRQGRLRDADSSLRDVLRIAAEQHDSYLEANAMGNLGFMFMNSFRYDEAIYWFARARPAFEKLHSRTRVNRTIGNLGWCYHRLGDETRAIAYLKQAEDGFRLLDDRYSRQIWLGNLSDVFMSQGDFGEAERIAKEALDMARGVEDKYWIAHWLNNLAVVSINLGDFDAAERYNQEALALDRANPGNQAGFYPRVNEAEIAAGRKNFPLAEKLYRDILAAPSDDPVPMLDAESELAALYIEKGDQRRAAAEFRAAIALIERSRANLKQDESKLTYLSSLIRFYQRFVDFLVAQDEPEKALEAAEASRARVLEEKTHSGPARPVSIAALEQLARASNAVLLSYWLAPDRSFLWVISGGGVKLHVLPPEKQIAPLVEGYRTFIENLRDPLDSEFSAGKKLAEILLSPVAADRILIVPDRALHSLNFETLPDPRNPKSYLIDRVTVRVAPSLGTLLQPRASKHAARSLLLIGDPEPVVEEYPRLPYAAKEIELISHSLPEENRVVLTGAQANPNAYREASPERFSWIHFAAHAAANRESPLDSALILSRRDSGYTLAARDVMNVPLNADLVTLSACRSAGSKTYSGEGLVGLSWAFLRAGAANVVAGLWDVTDMSTATLMSDFYDQLTKEIPPSDALRSAKLRLIHSKGAYKKPFYWGPFQLYTGSFAGKDMREAGRSMARSAP